MIKVARYAGGAIMIAGHANYAERGKDIVCAAVSALWQTLIVSLERLTNDKIEYNNAPGTASVKYNAKDLSEQAQLLIRSFFVGVSEIAEAYPEHVKIV